MRYALLEPSEWVPLFVRGSCPPAELCCQLWFIELVYAYSQFASVHLYQDYATYLAAYTLHVTLPDAVSLWAASSSGLLVGISQHNGAVMAPLSRKGVHHEIHDTAQ